MGLSFLVDEVLQPSGAASPHAWRRLMLPGVPGPSCAQCDPVATLPLCGLGWVDSMPWRVRSMAPGGAHVPWRARRLRPLRVDVQPLSVQAFADGGPVADTLIRVLRPRNRM